MKRYSILALGLGLGLLSCATPHSGASAAALTAPASTGRKGVVRGILAHNVRLEMDDHGQTRRTASGVVIASDLTPGGWVSYVLTNAHAVDAAEFPGAKLLALVDEKGSEAKFAATPVAVGVVPEMDLALLRVDGLKGVPASLAEDDELEPGESVMVAAAPYGKAVSLSGGLVSQVELDRKTHAPLMLKTDAPVGYGASGGGIYSLASGHLLAIVEGYRTAKVGFNVGEKGYSFDVPMPGETFAAPTAKLRSFLTSKGYARLGQPLVATAVLSAP